MKLSNERISNDSIRLSKIIEKNLPVKVSYAIAKNVAKMENELKLFNSERQKLIEKYSEKDDKGITMVAEGGLINIQKEYLDDWIRDFKDLLSIDNEIVIHTFDIGLLDGYDMSPSELMLIEYMIEE